jgi:benzoylformate decarboxylase/acetolactate synthase-1/2/3 large subunit
MSQQGETERQATPHRTEEITGAELLVRTLVRLGVADAFNIVGLGLFPLAEALYAHRDRIRYVTALNETNLALMATGYARAAGSAAFVNVYHASGTALGMMGVTTAWAEQVPLVYTTTSSSRALSGRDQYAAVPRAATEMSGQFVKWSVEVPSAARIPELLARAFQIATTPPYGPVHLSFPMDVWLETADDTSDAVGTLELFGAPAAAPAAIDRLEEILRESRSPLLVAGGEVARYAGVEALVSLAESTGAAVSSEDKISDPGFPTTHPQFIGKLGANRDAVSQADAIVLLGVELTESGLTAPIDFGEATTVTVSADPLALTRQLRPDVAVLGAPRPTLEALAERFLRHPLPADALQRRIEAATALHRRRELRSDALRAIRFDADELAISRIITEIDDAMPEGTILVNHCASGEPFVEELLPVDETGDYFGISSKASAQGWGGPAAIGIQLARPTQRVVALLGDGGFMFSSTAIHAAAQQRLPVVFVILDNGGWRDIGALARVARSPLADAEQEFGWEFDPPIDHAAFARSLGLDAHTARTAQELRHALAEAFASDRPSLIAVRNAPEDADEFSRVFTQREG